VRRLQRAHARLAVELSRSAEPDRPPPAGDDVRELRKLLRELGHPEAIAGPRSWRHTASTIVTTVVAIADEIAAAAELVMGKTDRIPVAIVRGLAVEGHGNAADLVMSPEHDLFR